MASLHAQNPITRDPDKAVCGCRLSAKPGRTFARRPSQMTCDSCVLRMLRTAQEVHGNDEGKARLLADEWPDADPEAWRAWLELKAIDR